MYQVNDDGGARLRDHLAELRELASKPAVPATDEPEATPATLRAGPLLRLRRGLGRVVIELGAAIAGPGPERTDDGHDRGAPAAAG